jgi:hypothetical protein
MKTKNLLPSQALEDLHSGLYKLRLRNEAGVFESVSRVHIEGPPGRKQQAAEAKRKEEEEKRRLQEEEERKKEVSLKKSLRGC